MSTIHTARPSLRILAISGSLRAASRNTALLRAAAGLVPDGVELALNDISEIPLYNDDAPPSEAVAALDAAIRDADGVLIATPEYNYGIPGVLKNAIDQASRPAYRSAFAHKPVAIVGAAGSTVGTARAQAHLKTVMLGMLAEVFPYPEFLLTRAHQRFDAEGRLTDEKTREILAALLEGFAEFIRRRAPVAAFERAA